MKKPQLQQRLDAWEQRYPGHVFRDGDTRFSGVRKLRGPPWIAYNKDPKIRNMLREKFWYQIAFKCVSNIPQLIERLMELMDTFESEKVAEEATREEARLGTALAWHDEEEEGGVLDENYDLAGSEVEDSDSDGYGPAVIAGGGQGYSAGH